MDHEETSSLAERIRNTCFATDKDEFSFKIRIAKINHRTATLQKNPSFSLLEAPSKKDRADMHRCVWDFCFAAAEHIRRFLQSLSGSKEDVAFSLLANSDKRNGILGLGFSGAAADAAMRTDVWPKVTRFLNSDDGRYETDQNPHGYGYKAREDDLLLKLDALLNDLLRGENDFENFARRNTLPLSERDKIMMLSMMLHTTRPWDRDKIETIFERLRKRIPSAISNKPEVKLLPED